MDKFIHQRPSSFGRKSQAGDKNSQVSEVSANSLTANINRLFDFSQTKIPGLYRVTLKHFILEYCESDAIACTKFHIKSEQFIPKFKEEVIIINGIQYCGYIEIQYPIADIINIYIPAYRSYDPAGLNGKQYINSRQFMIMLKLFSAEIRAAQLGVRERRIEKIKKNIESVCKIPESMNLLWNWIHIQIKLACYKKLSPPKYFEFIMNKILTEEFSLEERDDCKEYLEKCMRGGNIFLPVAYYKAVLTHEKNLPFDLRVLYSEIESKENQEDKASGVVLKYLPKMIPNITCVKEGKNYMKLAADCERLCKLYDANVHQNKCKVM